MSQPDKKELSFFKFTGVGKIVRFGLFGVSEFLAVELWGLSLAFLADM